MTDPGGGATTRRAFVAGLPAAGRAGAAALGASGAPGGGAPAGRAYYELRTYELRNDLDVGRARTFFAEHLVPGLKRAGAGPVAAFTPETGLPTPSVLLLVQYASLADVGAVADRLAADERYRAAADAFGRRAAPSGPAYVRYDAALYRAFAGHPRLEPPAAPGGAGAAGGASAGGAPPPGRVYELRTYEAPSEAGLRAKVAMFNDDEIRIFRECGFAPVFFGEAVAGARLPHLAYAVAFDSVEARAAAWARFVKHPDWQRIRVLPGNTDPEAVSVIRSAFLRAADFSDVR